MEVAEFSRDLETAILPIRDKEVRRRIVDIFTRARTDLNEDRVDVVVLAARTMACLYSLLVSRGFSPGKTGFICADRFLELQSQKWKGIRVRILDDSYHSGRTITELTDRVRKLVGPKGLISVDVIVSSSPRGDGVQFETEPLSLSETDAGEIHRDLARVLGGALMPYFTDFPVSSEASASAIEFDHILESTDWVVVDVTNAALAGGAHRSYSLMPRNELKDAIDESLSSIAHLMEICKVRLFTQDEGPTVRFRVVPIVSLRTLTIESVIECASELGIATSNDRVDQALGFIVYCAAHVVLNRFSAAFSNSVDGIELVSDESIAAVNVGTTLHAIAKGAAKTIGATKLLRSIGVSTPEAGGSLKQSLRWNDMALEDGSPLFILGDDLAKPLFDRIAAFNTADVQEHMDWGRVSITGASASKDLGTNTSTLSLSLDVLNDLGFAVPVNLTRDGSVVRAYRPGESSFEDELKVGKLGGRLATFKETLRIRNPSEVGSAEPVLRNI